MDRVIGIGETEAARVVLVNVGGRPSAIIASATNGPAQPAAFAEAMPIVDASSSTP